MPSLRVHSSPVPSKRIRNSYDEYGINYLTKRLIPVVMTIVYYRVLFFHPGTRSNVIANDFYEIPRHETLVVKYSPPAPTCEV